MTLHSATPMIFVTALLLTSAAADEPPAPDENLVRCANLVYGSNKTSVCFSDQFLKQINRDSNVEAAPRFSKVRLDSAELYDFPFAVMTGEGKFTLSDAQRENMREYLTQGGFMVASAGCSSKPWNKSFRQEMGQVFPDLEMRRLEAEHPIFHTVYDITQSRYKSGKSRLPDLRGLEIDGKIVLIWSPDGLNDTGNAGPNCCCCGGNEIKSAKQVNVNILAYALTH